MRALELAGEHVEALASRVVVVERPGLPQPAAHERSVALGEMAEHVSLLVAYASLHRRVGAEPMYCVNFLGDGDKRYANTREGNRTGDAREAADWVSYANDPDHPERKANGAAEPFNLKFWQLGNETSYGSACFKKDEAIAASIEFARAMRGRAPGST